MPTCNWATENAYYGVCVAKTCLANNVKNIRTITNFGPQIPNSPTQFGFSLAYDPNTGYSMTMQWADGLNGNYWIGPKSCLTYKIFAQQDQMYLKRVQTVADVKSKDDDKCSPAWPSSVYSETANSAQIVMKTSQADVQKYCLNDKNAPSGQAWYQCYFELAFLISGRTQFSVYFSFQSQINTLTGASINLNVLPK
jgi:hypothetical protein